MKVVWSPLAVQRARDAARHIAEEAPSAAGKWVDRLVDTVSSLESLPKRGRIVPEAGVPELRQLLVGKYRVIYRVEPRMVVILTVRHGRRLLDRRELTSRDTDASVDSE